MQTTTSACMICGEAEMERIGDWLICRNCRNRQDRDCPTENEIAVLAAAIRKAKGEEARTDLR